ncbi:MAG: 1-deoxy-D-xylulose-5-phosphate reductoisomerase [Clostridiales bacterium]|jgi:1-deoxy-D-xylulose-5-phosphate reductoisomerase|nr:1-deoxy-D-xylulose-5-phosphate reductoisomerase [Clostridiales bacterium]
MTTNLSILGSTGSIGTQALDVVRKLGIPVSALAAHHNIDLLERQIREYRPKIAAVYDESAAADLKKRIKDTSVKVYAGMDGLCQAAGCKDADTVLNAVVGMVGLQPTLHAIEENKNIALANKETLVAGGALVMQAAKEKGVQILPVDSEHSAIFQCLQGCPDHQALKRLILTASGGPFYGKTRKELKDVTPEQALRHPNWNMGAKVTIDSATMMNKGLELIEAFWLFDMPANSIDVVVHRESIIHSLIEYQDHSMIAQLGVPDMRIPIQYAITWPNRYPSPVSQLDLAKAGSLTFFEPDEETFSCLRACKRAIEKGGLAPAAANGANEVAVQLFLQGKLSFLDIGDLVEQAVFRQTAGCISCLEDILQADNAAREFVLGSVGAR